MKPLLYLITFILSSVFALGSLQTERITKDIHLQVVDNKGKLVEGAFVKYVCEHKESLDTKELKKQFKIKLLLATRTDEEGRVTVPYQGRLKAQGKDNPRMLLWVKGYFLITTIDSEIYKFPYRTRHLPEGRSSKEFPLKIKLTETIKMQNKAAVANHSRRLNLELFTQLNHQPKVYVRPPSVMAMLGRSAKRIHEIFFLPSY